MTKQQVSTDTAPAAIGPYSQAVRVGDFLYSSGQIPIDPASGQVVAGGIAEQTEQVCANLRALLQAAGTSLAQVVKTTVFLKSMDDFAAMNAVYARHFSADDAVAPARSTVEVARLPRDVLVEIDVIALIGDTVTL